MTGKIPALPQVYYPISDVRDVADIHVKAIKGESGIRYVAATEPYKFKEIADILYEEYSPLGYNVTTTELTKKQAEKLVKVVHVLKYYLYDWNVRVKINNKNAIEKLGHSYIPLRKTIKDAVESLINLNAVP